MQERLNNICKQESVISENVWRNQQTLNLSAENEQRARVKRSDLRVQQTQHVDDLLLQQDSKRFTSVCVVCCRWAGLLGDGWARISSCLRHREQHVILLHDCMIAYQQIPESLTSTDLMLQTDEEHFYTNSLLLLAARKFVKWAENDNSCVFLE